MTRNELVELQGASIGSSMDAEQDLLRRLRDGDRDAYRQAVERYSPRMLWTARRIVGPHQAEDIVQDAWISVLTNLHGFEGRSALGTWLVRITANRAISHVRSTTREVKLDLQEDGAPNVDWFDERGRWATPPAMWDAGSPDELMAAGSLQDCIDKHLDLMPESQRAVVIMRDMEQESFDHICNALNVSASNARVLLHRGRLRLLDMINGFQKTGAC